MKHLSLFSIENDFSSLSATSIPRKEEKCREVATAPRPSLLRQAPINHRVDVAIDRSAEATHCPEKSRDDAT